MATPRDLSSALTEGRERLLRAVAGVSEEQFKRRPPTEPDAAPEWSIAEVLAHLLYSERLRCKRIALALRDDGATIAAAPPDADAEATRAGRVAPVPQLIHGLLASRRELEHLLDQAGAVEGGVERAVVHSRRGRETIGWMLREQVIEHEAEHVAQIEALRPAVGAPPVESLAPDSGR